MNTHVCWSCFLGDHVTLHRTAKWCRNKTGQDFAERLGQDIVDHNRKNQHVSPHVSISDSLKTGALGFTFSPLWAPDLSEVNIFFLRTVSDFMWFRIIPTSAHQGFAKDHFWITSRTADRKCEMKIQVTVLYLWKISFMTPGWTAAAGRCEHPWVDRKNSFNTFKKCRNPIKSETYGYQQNPRFKSSQFVISGKRWYSWSVWSSTLWICCQLCDLLESQNETLQSHRQFPTSNKCF